MAGYFCVFEFGLLILKLVCTWKYSANSPPLPIHANVMCKANIRVPKRVYMLGKLLV